MAERVKISIALFSIRNLLLVFVTLAFVGGLVAYTIKQSKPVLVWTMVNVNHTALQGDAHLIEVNNGKTVLIDAGYLGPAKEKLVPLLKKRKVSHLYRITLWPQKHLTGKDLLFCCQLKYLG